MICLTIDQVLKLHQVLIKEFGGEYGIRDYNLLDLSLNSSFQTFNGEDLYQGPLKKIIHVSYSLIKNHPFVDGNKRIGAHLLLVLLELNGYSINYEQEELIAIILNLAASKQTEKDLLIWVQSHLI